MEVTLLHHTPLEISNIAISKCWDRDSDTWKERMYRIGNKYKHGSTLEHINYNFEIRGVSRGLLQELARHRMQSLSVKSTRYTLKELKDALQVDTFFVPTGDPEVDERIEDSLWETQAMLKRGVSNDIVKYMLPEAYKTSLVSTMNMRGLQNFLKLRTNKAALWEIRELAYQMYHILPDAHKFMLEDFVYAE